MAEAVGALLFDLGGVLVRIDFGRAFDLWAQKSGADAVRLQSRFEFDDAYKRHERGEIEVKEYFEALRDTLGINLSDAQLLAGWNAIFLDEMPGMRELLNRLEGRLPLYVFSNTNTAHQFTWSKNYAELLTSFQEIFVSSDLGVRKPEADAFRCVCERLGEAPEHVLFFDDTRANVSGALAVGMQAYLTTCATEVESAINVRAPHLTA